MIPGAKVEFWKVVAVNPLKMQEMLEDLVTAAFNEAGRRADEAMKSNLTGMLGGLNLPPGLL